MLERHTDPVLHHTVTLKRTGDVLADVEWTIIAQLDRLEVHWDAGRPTCEDALREAGITPNGKRMPGAVAKRRARGAPAHGPVGSEELHYD